MLIAGGVAYAVLNRRRRQRRAASGGKQAAAAKVKPSEIEVAVLNGTSTAGLAATYGDKVEGKGFELGAVTNSSSSFEDSVVMFKRGHEPEANKVAKQLSIPKCELMSAEIDAVAAGANVAVVVGEDNAAAEG